jgi:hypothetical protein
MNRAILILLLTSSIQIANSQVGIGSWQSHNPMSSFTWIGETESKVFAANKFGILSYDREEGSTESLTKVTSLSGTEISAFECQPDKGICVVGYSNGNLDFISDNGTISNQPAIMNSQTVGYKSVNAIGFEKNVAWLGTGIGILKIDLSTFNVLEYTPVLFNGENQPVNELFIDDNDLTFCSEDYLLQTSAFNLFENPSYTDISPNIQLDRIAQILELDDQLHIIYNTPNFIEDTIYQFQNGSWAPIDFMAGLGIRHIEVSDTGLLITNATSINHYDQTRTLLSTIFTYGPTGLNPSEARWSKYSDKIIVADIMHGGVEVSFQAQFSGTRFNVSSPFPVSTSISSLAIAGNTVYALPGGNEFTFLRPNIHKYESNEWVSKELINQDIPNFVNGNALVKINDELYIASDRGGLAITNEDLVLKTVLDDANSPLVDFREDYRYFGLSGLDKDSENNLYISHTKDKYPLKIYLESGDWVQISFPDDNLKEPKCGDILVSQSGLVFQIVIDIGVLVYDTKNSPEDISDDQYFLLTSSPSSGNLPSSQVTCISEDLDGEIWIGTNEGIGIIYSPESIFEPNFEGAQQVIVNQDGYNGYLFGTETIEDIEVDGANRKWVGTFSSGLFQISEDGQEQLNSFTTENSPLFDNKIADIAILPNTGEVFIATETGLVSYRGDATSGSNSLDNIKVFPNPIRPNYNGPIAISNLSVGSQVRITDVNGRLVFETLSLGGQATWEGTDLNGNRVPAGIYLVSVSTSAADQGVTSKILFLK